MRLINHIGIRCVLLPLIAMAAGFHIVRRGFGSFSAVEGYSMIPTLKPNDVVQTKTLSGESQRGDVIIVTDNDNERAIKRIIGLPGETLILFRGFVYIDCQRLNEPYLPKFTYTFKNSPDDERAITWRLGANQYFLMGDNRLESCDSRNYGPVERRQIKGIVKLPENSPKPGFCELVLSESGKVMPGKLNHHRQARNRSRSNPQNFNVKI